MRNVPGYVPGRGSTPGGPAAAGYVLTTPPCQIPLRGRSSPLQRTGHRELARHTRPHGAHRNHFLCRSPYARRPRSPRRRLPRSSIAPPMRPCSAATASSCSVSTLSSSLRCARRQMTNCAPHDRSSRAAIALSIFTQSHAHTLPSSTIRTPPHSHLTTLRRPAPSATPTLSATSKSGSRRSPASS